MPDTATPETSTHCLERALLHRMPSVAFRHPDHGTPEALRQLAAAARGTAPWPPLTRERLEAVAHALDGVEAGALVARHERAFAHSVRSGATPYETECGDPNDTFIQSRDVADIGGFYLAAGLRPDAPERLPFLLRRELLYVADMLDPAFGYDPAAADREFPPRGARPGERYRTLWALSVEQRLLDEGHGGAGRVALAEATVSRAFPHLTAADQGDLRAAVRRGITRERLVLLVRAAAAP
jgi:hypothetical protein